MAFTLPDGDRWEWLVWPFGFVNSPYAMEKMVQPLVRDIPGAVSYVDDITIFTPESTEDGELPVDSYQRDLDAHIESVREFLRRCRKYDVFLSASKAQILEPVVDVLGSRVEVGKAIYVLPSRAEELANAPVPYNVKTLERAVGALTYVAPSIIHFAQRIAPLRELLRQARALDRRSRKGGRRPSSILFPLSGAALWSFRDLCAEMSSPRTLAPFRPDVTPFVVSDASQYGVAATLYQESRLVATWSKALSDAQSRWRVFDLEAFA